MFDIPALVYNMVTIDDTMSVDSNIHDIITHVICTTKFIVTVNPTIITVARTNTITAIEPVSGIWFDLILITLVDRVTTNLIIYIITSTGRAIIISWIIDQKFRGLSDPSVLQNMCQFYLLFFSKNQPRENESIEI